MSIRFRDACVATLASLIVAVMLTWPVAPRLGSAGRIDSGDGRHGVWNVSWVARALTTDPRTLFDANIFYPSRQTLAYSEPNLVAGALAVPVWLATGNPYASYNVVLLLAFAASALSAYLLARKIGASRAGGAVAALIYGFSPYMFAHLPHIQLLMTFGPPLSLAAMHHFIAAPSLRRGAVLGCALALTALACGYYGIFAGLATGFGLCWYAIAGRLWAHRPYWTGLVAAGVVGLVIIGPAFWPYLDIRDAGFGRTLDDARMYSTSGRAYLASAAWMHRWMLPLIGQWREVLFPGFLPVLLTLVAGVLAVRPSKGRATVAFYSALGLFAFWLSFGPDAGLYALLYEVVPVFSFLRAPVRFGVLVILSMSVLSSLAITWIQNSHWRMAPVLTATFLVLGVAESYVGPLRLADAPPVEEAYRRLAVVPRAPVAEFPFYRGAVDRHRQTEYMLMSTYHWQPLVNGYSDHRPAGYSEDAQHLARFPTEPAWRVLRDRQVRWVVVHFDRYSAEVRQSLRSQLRKMTDRLRVVVDQEAVSLYEVIWPSAPDTAH